MTDVMHESDFRSFELQEEQRLIEHEMRVSADYAAAIRRNGGSAVVAARRVAARSAS